MLLHRRATATLGLLLALCPLAAQPADLDEALELATKAAIARISPFVVQIRTVGGLETVGKGQAQMLRGRGPTTGLIVDPDGYILSSSFNFANQPAAITVVLPGVKEPFAAKVVAQDKTRLLTLLKVEATGLPVPSFVPKADVKLGQWCLAVGRALAENPDAPPSASVGVVSATGRILGKAIQTDAKISPVNYGGPLIDFSGRVFGVLAPLASRGEGETAGAEWYDAGIGFAVPLEDVFRVLPKLKAGKTLDRGVLGITWQGEEGMASAPVIGAVTPGTPAAQAGLEAGDTILAVDGKLVERQSQVRQALGPLYEGDKIALKVKRGDKEIDVPAVTLAGTALAHTHAFLGIVPMRDDDQAGIEARYVFPKGAADQAGMKAGDRIVKVEERPILHRGQLLGFLNTAVPGQKIKLEVKRKADGKTETLTVTLGAMGEEVPGQLPGDGSFHKALTPPRAMPMLPGLPMGNPPRPAQPQPQPKPEDAPKKDVKKGLFTQVDPTLGHGYWAYVPENYDPNVSHALVVWLQPKGDTLERTVAGKWQELCKERHLILLAPKAEDPSGWLTSEADTIKGYVREFLENYTIDRQRVVLHGLGNGAALAFYLAFDTRELVRGVAAVGGVLSGPVPENNAGQRLAFFLVGGAKDPDIEAIRGVPAKLREKKFPVAWRELPNEGHGYPPDAVIQELARWIDSLDRL